MPELLSELVTQTALTEAKSCVVSMAGLGGFRKFCPIHTKELTELQDTPLREFDVTFNRRERGDAVADLWGN